MLQCQNETNTSSKSQDHKIHCSTADALNQFNLLKHESKRNSFNLMSASRAAVRHGIMSADLTEVAAVSSIVAAEAAINQPRLVKVWMSCVDVR